MNCAKGSRQSHQQQGREREGGGSNMSDYHLLWDSGRLTAQEMFEADMRVGVALREHSRFESVEIIGHIIPTDNKTFVTN